MTPSIVPADESMASSATGTSTPRPGSSLSTGSPARQRRLTTGGRSPSPMLPPSPAARQLSQTTADILGHLFSPTAAYQSRALLAYYHPVLASYADQFVAVQGVPGIQLLFQWYFPWLCHSTDLHIDQVTVSAATITFTSSEHGTVKRPAQLVAVESTLRCPRLTVMGRVLSLLRLLPAPTYLATASTLALSALSRPKPSQMGVRITTKLYWMAAADVQQAARELGVNTAILATSIDASGVGGGGGSIETVPHDQCIVHHEDLYRIDGAMRAILLYPVFWLLLMARLVFGLFQRLWPPALTQAAASLRKFVAPVRQSSDTIVVTPALTLASVEEETSVEVASHFKYVVGAMLVGVLVPAFERATGRQRIRVRPQKPRVTLSD